MFKLPLKKYIATLSYIVAIVVLNRMFVYLPHWHIFGQFVSSADVIAGAVYIVRDFAQREIRHYVIVAMIVAGILSYVLASREVALASVSAFFVGESIDWAIFTFTKKPLSQRLLLSSIISTPFDSIVFLAVLHQLNWVSFALLVVGKFFGVFVLWLGWKLVNIRATNRVVI